MNKWIVRSLLIALLVVAFAAGLYIWSEYRAFNRPWGTEADTFTYEIPEGMGARQIASMLKEKGVIHNVNTFLVVADLRGIGGQLKAGEYEFEGTKTPYEILSMLSIGWAKRHRLVIPEGFTQLDIGKRCEEMLICTKEEFLKACHADPIFAWIVAQAPGGAAAGSEGTLFPDTYLLIKNTPGYKVYEKMRKQFETVWSELRKKIDEDGITGLWWQDNNITAREQALNVLILASIIEKEAKRDEDRPLIASVFVNRLKKKMPLQSDATIHYFLNDWSRPLTKADLETDSPYNTYKYPGLPAAPICNPGRKSLEAALRPADTEYLFFMSKSDGSMVFNTTHDDHVNLKNQLKRERQQARDAAEASVAEIQDATVHEMAESQDETIESATPATEQ